MFEKLLCIGSICTVRTGQTSKSSYKLFDIRRIVVIGRSSCLDVVVGPFYLLNGPVHLLMEQDSKLVCNDIVRVYRHRHLVVEYPVWVHYWLFPDCPAE